MKEGKFLDQIVGCVLQGTFFEPICVAPRTGAGHATTLHGIHRLEIPAQAPLSSTQLTPHSIHLSNLD